jgi:hypothetical protein
MAATQWGEIKFIGSDHRSQNTLWVNLHFARVHPFFMQKALISSTGAGREIHHIQQPPSVTQYTQ